VSDSTHPPIAVRVVRPYETEDAFLASELETVGKTSLILLGAHARDAGTVLRFEVALSTGDVILRGDGRVLTYKERAFRGQPGLALRFLRLDPRSKERVDRATTLREARLAEGLPRATSPDRPSSVWIADPASDSIPASASEAAPPSHASLASTEPLASALSAPRLPQIDREPLPVLEPPPSTPPSREPTPARTAAAPPDRQALLERLRSRGASMTDEQRQAASRNPSKAPSN
jgi:hypothetical protein